MKTMLLLGAASSFLIAFAPAASLAQTEPSISSASVALTCRTVLQGGQFSQVLDVASPPCCYVSIEEDWYKANGVVLSAIYQRPDGDTYHAESCDLISENGRLVDQSVTGSIGGDIGAPGAGQSGGGGLVTPGPIEGQGTAGASAGSGNAGNGNNNGGNTNTGNIGGGSAAGHSGGSQGGNGGTNTGGNGGQTGGGSGDDGNNGHGNDVGGVDPSNPGNSSGTHGGHASGGNGGGNEDHEKGNNGFGNGGGDGSPNGKQDETR